MLNGWTDIERTLAEMDAFRRQMDTLFGGESARRGAFGTPSFQYLGWSAFPEATLADSGAEFVLTAEVPGLGSEDVDLQVTSSGLTIQGERKLAPPKGYDVHREERRSYKFSRSFNFPVKVDPEKVTAEVKNGVLTVHLPKAAEVQPRRITIKS